jgi:hypothetical protein
MGIEHYSTQIDAFDNTKTSNTIILHELTADLLSPMYRSHPSYGRDMIGAWSDFKMNGTTDSGETGKEWAGAGAGGGGGMLNGN